VEGGEPDSLQVLAEEREGLPGAARGLVLRPPRETAGLRAGETVETGRAGGGREPKPMIPVPGDLEGDGLRAAQVWPPQVAAPDQGLELGDHVIEGQGVHAGTARPKSGPQPLMTRVWRIRSCRARRAGSQSIGTRPRPAMSTPSAPRAVLKSARR